ncbi:hypothetical protein [Paenibacillus sp. XY044]|uniref:hypothetical protein n=1 Tax=Paenibacillus sp. XY044 TaxID=2026089 RepID=UPI000B9936E4|nr:hypothetical protein [Paenibacillus sp. XY044]OZB98139.1 hypothetical protein CJP46_02925 [Paenibacillus sp. XY044]
MTEGKVLAVAKKPLLSRKVAHENDYETAVSQWELQDLFLLHGGSPTIDGVVTIDTTQVARQFPRYKLLYPDGFVDYARIDSFSKWYDMVIR